MSIMSIMSIITSHRRAVAVTAVAIPTLITGGWVAWPEEARLCGCGHHHMYMDATYEGADRVEH